MKNYMYVESANEVVHIGKETVDDTKIQKNRKLHEQ